MKINEYLKNPLHPITVNLIGVGGTGSLVLPRLARLDFSLKLLGHPGLMVFAFDGDKVEEFNVGRQNFSDCDLGKNKAIALIEKCNLAFGTLWKAYPREFILTKKYKNINIICVDNVDFRKNYYEHLSINLPKKPNENTRYDHDSFFYTIDSGNGKDFGQVIISGQPGMKNPFEIFKEMESQDNEEMQGIQGCSYQESLERQDLFVNDEMALSVCNILWKLFRENDLTINGIISNINKNKKSPIKL